MIPLRDDTDNPFSTVSYSAPDTNGIISITSTDTEGVISITMQNKLGQTVYTSSQGSTAEYIYDNAGNQVQYKDGSNYIVETDYDILGRQVRSIGDPTVIQYPTVTQNSNGKNETSTFGYDLAGNTVYSNSAGVEIETQYDAASRVVHKESTQQVNGVAVTIESNYSYDGTDNGLILNTVTDGLGRVKEYRYNNLGQLVSEVDKGDTGNATERVTAYTYDNNGNMLTMTRSDNSVVTYTYDEQNRMTRKEYSTSHYVTYAYDDNGNLLTMTQVVGSVTTTSEYEYDASGSKTGEKRNSAYIAKYEYYDNGSLKKISYPQTGGGWRDILYSYDTEGRLETISDCTGQQDGQIGPVIRQFFYDANGKLSYLEDYREFDTLGTDFTRQTFTYDNVGTLTAVNYLDNNVTSKESYELTMNSDGKITQEEITTNYGSQQVTTKNYTYDPFGRLAQESTNGLALTVINYEYDAVNNRVKMTQSGDEWDYIYNEFNQLTEVLFNNVTQTTYTYDGRGNQITRTEGGVTTTYIYDLADRLIEITRTESGITTTVATYTYDGADQRVSQTEGEDTTVYFYNGIVLLYTEDGSGNKIEENIVEPDGGIVASKRFSGIYSGQHFFYRQDIRGSVTNIVDENGDVVKGYTYTAFGNTTVTGSSTFINSTAYTGAVLDNLTGLYYMNARYYSPETGRFLTMDSYVGNLAEPWPWHLYAYCEGDPVNNIDPSGHMSRELLNMLSFVYNVGIIDSDTLSYMVLALNGLNVYTAFHEMAQLFVAKKFYDLRYSGVVLEKAIKINSKYIGEADVYARVSGISRIWEIKPLYGSVSAEPQLVKYTTGTGLFRGGYFSGFSANILSLFKMLINTDGKGGIYYSITYKWKIVSHVELAKALQKVIKAACAVALGIIIGTLLEDIATGGIGVWNDGWSLGGAAASMAGIIISGIRYLCY